MTEQTHRVPHLPVSIPDGRVRSNGKTYMTDAKGSLVPVELIQPEVLLEDDVVRKIMGYAIALSEQVSRFKGHAFEDIAGFQGLLEQEYDATLGGAKGNKTLMSHCGLYKIQVQVADHVDFGPQLQIAKGLLDECLNEWAADARPEIRAIITRAFNTDKAGQINRAEIFMLLRLDITDARWVRAMDAIRAAMRVVGSKTYMRFYRRDHCDGQWDAVPIDMARA